MSWEVKQWFAGGIEVTSEEGNVCVCGGADAVKNAKVIAAVPEMVDAIKCYSEGIDHFYKCIDFGKSVLDADAISFMNESNIKLRKATKKIEGK